MVTLSEIAGALVVLSVVAGCFTKPERVSTIGDGNTSADARRIDGPMSPLCFGRDAFTVCLPALPTASFEPGTALAIDTNEAACTGSDRVVVDPKNGGPKLCVISATSVTIIHDIVAQGELPLVIVATEAALAVTASALIDASSAPGVVKGAGANYAGCPSVLDGAGGAGGAGGSFGSKGGNAGNVGGDRGGTAGARFGPVFVHGGCAGGRGGGDNARGEGGGAIYLLAKTSLTISGKINASGQGGAGGAANEGGGGGGSGGLIALWAGDVINASGSEMWANGGGGGGGGHSSSAGDPGEVSLAAMAVGRGGAAGGSQGSTGGDGAIGSGDGGSSNTAGKGSGGGGGGGGVILNVSGQAMSGTQSPPVTVY